MEEVKQVFAGDYHTCAIKQDNSLWCWGFNADGQVGDGTTELKTDFVRIMDDVLQVSAGGYNTCAVKSDGSLWCWGSNRAGQIGDGTVVDVRASPVQIMLDVYSVSVGGDLYGGAHVCSIKNSSLWCWGENTYGQDLLICSISSYQNIKLLRVLIYKNPYWIFNYFYNILFFSYPENSFLCV